ncbi:unnamed protein product [Symbiodinium natans]|uniref:Uncharacterized protein n=1 Tax=Symbiodinium natans TaxID=878477 RepID=A0A812R3V6_9DINO|nr:unnamed protein product [Symbiodinium natans]
MFYKYSGIRAEENNKTLEMARQMKIRLMTEEEESLQATSKKIYWALAISGTLLCCCCVLNILLNSAG